MAELWLPIEIRAVR